jgi:hypothetical protein
MEGTCFHVGLERSVVAAFEPFFLRSGVFRLMQRAAFLLSSRIQKVVGFSGLSRRRVSADVENENGS